jgi:hypothetical protein
MRAWISCRNSGACTLRKELDCVAATAGPAGSLQGTLLAEYLAGIWKSDLARGLRYGRVKPPASETGECKCGHR